MAAKVILMLSLTVMVDGVPCLSCGLGVAKREASSPAIAQSIRSKTHTTRGSQARSFVICHSPVYTAVYL